MNNIMSKVENSHDRRLSIRTRLMLAAQKKVQMHHKIALDNNNNVENTDNSPEMKLQQSFMFSQAPNSQISDELKNKITKMVEASCPIQATLPQSGLLDFCGLNLGYGGVLHVLNEIHDHTTSSLLTLNFSGCSLDERGMSVVYRIVKLCKNAKELDLSRNSIGRSGITWAAKILQNTEICFLKLPHNGLNDQDMEVLLAALPESDTIIDLDLSYNILGPYTGELITKFLPLSRVQCLNLSHNELGAEGTRQMVEGLQENESLEELDLSWNYLYDKGMVPIADIILTVPMLRKVSLNGNFISSTGAAHIASSLRENFTLEVLELAQNFLRSQGACALVRGVRSNLASKLRVMNINGTLVEHEFMVMYRRIQLDKMNFEVTGFCVVGEDSGSFTSR